MPVVLMLFLSTGNAGATPVPDQDCVIEPHTVVDLASAVEGIVESLEVERGDLVERDQVLVKLDAGVERAAVNYARARAEATAQLRAGEANAGFAQRRANRVNTLYEQKVASSDQMDEATTQTRLTKAQADQAAENRRLAQLELRQAEENLARHVIRSPIRGVVVQDYLSPGESVKDKPIMRLAEIDPLRVEVIVPVAFFGAIQAGQVASIQPEAPREGSYPATVTIVDRVADSASGTFRVRLSLPNKDYSLPSGLKCRVAFGAFQPANGVKAATAATAVTAEPELKPLPPATPGGVARYARRVPALPPVDQPVPVSPASALVIATGTTVETQPVAAVNVTDPAPLQAKAQTRTRTKTPAAVPAEVPAKVPPRLALVAPANEVVLPFCLTIGPVVTEKRAGELRAALANQVASLSIRSESIARGNGQQFWLDVQSAGSRADEAMTRTLARLAPELDLDLLPCSRLVAAR